MHAVPCMCITSPYGSNRIMLLVCKDVGDCLLGIQWPNGNRM